MIRASADDARREDLRAHVRALVVLLGEALAPLLLYYGLRALGVGVWSALVVSAAFALVVVAVGVVIRRRLDTTMLGVLGLLLVGTAVGFIAADARAVVARGSWLTAAVGVWATGSVFAARPLLFHGTLRLMPPAAAKGWQDSWNSDPAFRRLLRGMTLAFGIAFLLDAAARVVMAYSLPLDAVPLLANLLLGVMLTAVVLVGKARGRRLARKQQSVAARRDVEDP